MRYATLTSIFTRRRSRDPTESDILDNISDVQNGLFLNKFTHGSLGRDVAFLVVRLACTIQTRV